MGTEPDDRYARQISLPGFGSRGQEALARARVLCIGAGGLGSPAAIYLATAGVGTLGLIDDDRVELSNLHRQPLHTTADVGLKKVDSAARTLRALNPDVRIVPIDRRLDAADAVELVDGWDLVIDGSDSFATRYIVSDATTLLGIPHLWAAVLGYGGQLSVFDPVTGPTYRDLFPRIPAPGSVPSCVQAGVLGVLPGIMGTALAAEAIKLITGIGTVLRGRVGVYDMRTAQWEFIDLAARESTLRPAGPDQIGQGLAPAVSAGELHRLLAGTGHAAPEAATGTGTTGTAVPVVDVRTPAEHAADAIPGSVNLPVEDIAADPVGAVARLMELGGEPGAGAPRRCYVYCESGTRSAHAVRLLGGTPGLQPIDVTGGMRAWRALESRST
ncbi:ThiF family adenylyltransferase [Brevibacterium sp. 91QC2O2]|uniref:ThiF family adenylyltransferase n=1 Tax=Brevibacterium sp. 91QC2O2 TaxID=2968458 RepID=UPI00211C0928|nr:ThiF family adenylyltransferase [Brevibacterium sp. 91QC2O2]MCQ9368787.1 ThiF family adenylyltransferase [Brevibacterium sp. 91QC2O2]